MGLLGPAAAVVGVVVIACQVTEWVGVDDESKIGRVSYGGDLFRIDQPH